MDTAPMTETYISSIEAQIIGRVFTHDDAIHFVLGTDAQTGMARCSRRTPDGPDITYIPLVDVQTLLATGYLEPVKSEPVAVDPGMILQEAS
jgi:hypothetical protein